MERLSDAFVRSVRLERDKVPDFTKYPFTIPAVRGLTELDLDPKITFFVGENGTGKSTLVEAIAVKAGFNAEGGSNNFAFRTRSSESELHQFVRLVRGIRRPRTGYFLRAESYFNVATEVEELSKVPFAGKLTSHGERSLHEQSHGESFLALVTNRFWADGLYVLDEPEAALSPTRQLTLLKVLHELIEEKRCQFVIATHSPILLAYPSAIIYNLAESGITSVRYEDTEHFSLTRDFLNNRDLYLRRIFMKDE